MKGLFVFSHDMEDGESLFTRALLVRAGLTIHSITFENTLEIKTGFGLIAKADFFATSIHDDDYDFLIIPGGKYVAKVVDQDQNIKNLAKLFHQKKKMIAAICAGPRFLGQAGILEDRAFTCFSGCEVDMKNGTYLPHQKAVRDQHIITARGAGAIYEFAYEIIKYTLGEREANALLTSILH